MATPVFYAWQSDRPEDVCHYFIRDCATDAIEQLKQDADASADTQVEEADAPSDDTLDDVELDHDTKGVTGTPNIAETIRQKIAACAVFIADLTHVTPYTTADDRKKEAQNGNVLIELGLALTTKPLDRILLVMNTAFGSWQGLPFDLRLYRRPIRYNLPNTSNGATVAKVKAELTEQLKVALKLILSGIAKKEAADRLRLDTQRRDERLKEAERLREQFEDDMEHGRFEPFNPDAPMIAMTLFPLVPQTVGIKRDEVGGELPPFWTSDYNNQIDSGGLVTFKSGITNNQGKLQSQSVAKLFRDGRVYAAALMAGHLPKAGRGNAFDLGDAERATIFQGQKYMKLLRRLGVKGPILFGLSVCRVRGMHLGASTGADGGRIMSDPFIRPPLVELPADMDGSNEAAIAKAMKPLFDSMWQAANFESDPYLTDDGRWIGRF